MVAKTFGSEGSGGVKLEGLGREEEGGEGAGHLAGQRVEDRL